MKPEQLLDRLKSAALILADHAEESKSNYGCDDVNRKRAVQRVRELCWMPLPTPQPVEVKP